MNCLQAKLYVTISESSLIIPITKKAKENICMVTIIKYIVLQIRLTYIFGRDQPRGLVFRVSDY